MALRLRMLVLAVAAAAAADARASECTGYLATGAGDPASNGCYSGTAGGDHFVLDARHTLYADGGVWRVGWPGRHVRYVAKAATSGGPPLAAAGWQCGAGPAPGYPRGINGSACPAPSWTAHLPTPPPAPPGAGLFPVPTAAADQAVDCAVRASAWEFAKHIQPFRGAHLPVFDALELATRCRQARPPAGAQHAVSDGGGTAGQPAFHANALVGRDTGAGTLGAPFATIGHGVRACRAATQRRGSGGGGGGGGGGCTVFLADAAPFVLNETLALGPADALLTIKPEPGSKSPPVITSSVRLRSRWAPHNVTHGQNVWKTAVPPGLAAAAVYIAGRRGVLARWPNVDDPATAQVPLGYAAPAGWLPPRPRPAPTDVPQPDAARPADLTFPSWTWGRVPAGSPPTFLPAEGYWLAPRPAGGSMYVVPAGVVYGAEAAAFSERASSWGNASTGHVHAFHGGYWGNWVFEIKSHDAANRTLHFGVGGSQGQYTAAAPPPARHG